MIRLAILTCCCAGLAIYAFRDWYRSLCGLVVMMAFLEHPDMPTDMFGVQGLNPFNLVLLCVLIAWISSRRREQLQWDMPPWVGWLMLAYLIVILVSFGRMIVDRSQLLNSVLALTSEDLINTLKWVIPGILLFDGCRTRERFVWGVVGCVAIYVFLALQVIRWVPPTYLADGAALQQRSVKTLHVEIGYFRITLAMMLAGGSWALLGVRNVIATRRWIPGLLFAMTSYALVLTAGRAGYMSWIVIALLISAFRWRKGLLLAPLLALLVVMFAPGVVQRSETGFSDEGVHTNEVETQGQAQSTEDVDVGVLMAGRNLIWDAVIPKIWENPLTGYGRLAIRRTGIEQQVLREYGEDFGHPHNAYLEFLLDNGVIGLVVVIAFYFSLLGIAISLLRDKSLVLANGIGWIALCLIVTQMVASISGQTFYPIEASVGMWVAIGLCLRVYVERKKTKIVPAPITQPAKVTAWWPAEPALAASASVQEQPSSWILEGQPSRVPPKALATPWSGAGAYS